MHKGIVLEIIMSSSELSALKDYRQYCTKNRAYGRIRLRAVLAVKILQPDRTCKYTVNIIEGDMLQASIRDMHSQVDLYHKMVLKAANPQFFPREYINVRVDSSGEHRFQGVKS